MYVIKRIVQLIIAIIALLTAIPLGGVLLFAGADTKNLLGILQMTGFLAGYVLIY
ncbi:MAG TPA: hypothetical protein VLG37_01520 [Candidatus Saccharimonadales bacterium]|nr:hypothetical protein [Candidatus Saccharimonadales bacterium]